MNARIEWIDETGSWNLGGFGLGALTTSEVRNIQISMNSDIRDLNRETGSVEPTVLEDGVAGDETCATADFLNNTFETTRKPTTFRGPYPDLELCRMAVARQQGLPVDQPTAKSKKKKSNWGLALLGAAAVIAGVYALS